MPVCMSSLLTCPASKGSLVVLAVQVENHVVGAPCGVMDQVRLQLAGPLALTTVTTCALFQQLLLQLSVT